MPSLLSFWILPAICFAAAIGGMAYVLVHAFIAGSEEYSGAYSEHTARQFEDIFLFIPPKRLEEIRWIFAAIMFLLFFMLTGSFGTTRGFTIGFLCGLAAAGFALYLPNLLLKILRKRRLQKFNSQLVDTLISMSNAPDTIAAAFPNPLFHEMIPITKPANSIPQNGNTASESFGLAFGPTKRSNTK